MSILHVEGYARSYQRSNAKMEREKSVVYFAMLKFVAIFSYLDPEGRRIAFMQMFSFHLHGATRNKRAFCLQKSLLRHLLMINTKNL